MLFLKKIMGYHDGPFKFIVLPDIEIPYSIVHILIARSGIAGMLRYGPLVLGVLDISY